MKKLFSAILAISMLFSLISIKPSFAKDNITYVGSGYIQEITTENPNTKKWLVVDGNNKFDLFIDYQNQIMMIDNETIHYTVEEVQLPVTRATVDYSTARKFKSKIPWKGSVTLLAAAIAGLVSGGAAAGWAATIAGALTADAENIWLTFTQYDSKESYYSSYNGVYYKKCINKDITFYETSVSSANIIYGPVDGTWFDPIRP